MLEQVPTHDVQSFDGGAHVTQAGMELTLDPTQADADDGPVADVMNADPEKVETTQHPSVVLGRGAAQEDGEHGESVESP